MNLLILAVAILSVLSFILLRRTLRLKKKLLKLAKELEVVDSRLKFQKSQYSESANYYSSAMIIIMELMRQIDDVLKSEEENLVEKILQITFEKTNELFRPERCILFKVDAEKKLGLPVYSFGYKENFLRSLSLSLDADNSFAGWSASTGRFLSFDNAQQDSLLSHLIEKDPLKCQYCQPLKVENEVKAVLCTGPLSAQSEKDVILQLFSILSNIASVSLSNALLTQRLRELAIRDSLTGLFNHSYFQRWLEDALSKLTEKGHCLSLAMADLDYFKKVNDTYGHQTGDIVLKSTSELLNNLGVPNYICSRYGGEEFALAFMGKDKSQARIIMEEVRNRIAQKVFAVQNKRLSISISAGIAEAQFSETKKIEKKDLIESADQALYQAKAEGRNRVITA